MDPTVLDIYLLHGELTLQGTGLRDRVPHPKLLISSLMSYQRWFWWDKCLWRWLTSVMKGKLIQEGSLCPLPHIYLPQMYLAFFWILAKSHVPFSSHLRVLLLASPQHHLALGKEVRWRSGAMWGPAPPPLSCAVSGSYTLPWKQGERWKPTQKQSFTWTLCPLFLPAKFLPDDLQL